MTKNMQETLQLGEPVVHRGITIAPLFPRLQPRAEYLTLEDAIPLGFSITEIDASGSVPELLAHNPLEANVLLYDGEELLGAKQNRILNVTVLVPAQSDTRIPVSCVEEGRWSARSVSFNAAPHASYPELRRRKAEALSAAPLDLGIAQADVWHAVDVKSARHRVASSTRAQADIFRGKESDLATLRNRFRVLPGQSGAVVALGQRQLCLDYVSRPNAFARLYPKLLDGYLLDAIEVPDGEPAGDGSVESFVAATLRSTRSRRASAGAGIDLRLRAKRIVGSGLELDGELLQLSAFSTDRPARERTVIARPSRRR
jgi:hypothetical protein